MPSSRDLHGESGTAACGKCGGTGVYLPGNPRLPCDDCEHCDGTGVVSVETAPFEWRHKERCRMEKDAVVLSFYDHHRQSYGHMPIREDRVDAEFMVGDYGPVGETDHGVGEGGEFAIQMVRLSYGLAERHHYLAPLLRVFHDATGSLRAFLDSGAWDAICDAAGRREIRDRSDLTSLLTAAGLADRSEKPIDWKPVCPCCNQPKR